MNIQQATKVWVVWQNSDLTEGRGYTYPLHVCELETTARRLGKGQDVQGTDCHITESLAYKIDGEWYMLNRLERPRDNDRELQEKLDNRRAAIAKARAAGLSEEDIKHLL